MERKTSGRGAVHFTFVDSSAGSLLDGEFTYLDTDLAASQAPVKMVFVHHPALRSGRYGSHDDGGR